MPYCAAAGHKWTLAGGGAIPPYAFCRHCNARRSVPYLTQPTADGVAYWPLLGIEGAVLAPAVDDDAADPEDDAVEWANAR